MFKQFLANEAVDIVQIDSCRLGGLNEVSAVQLMAAKYDKPVWPHGGGVGLCEYVQHFSIIAYMAVTSEKDTKRVEYVGHMHEHFVDPCIVRKGAYQAPVSPGFSIEINSESLLGFLFRPHVAAE